MDVAWFDAEAAQENWFRFTVAILEMGWQRKHVHGYIWLPLGSRQADTVEKSCSRHWKYKIFTAPNSKHSNLRPPPKKKLVEIDQQRKLASPIGGSVPSFFGHFCCTISDNKWVRQGILRRPHYTRMNALFWALPFRLGIARCRHYLQRFFITWEHDRRTRGCYDLGSCVTHWSFSSRP